MRNEGRVYNSSFSARVSCSPLFVPIHQARSHSAYVGAGADHEENDQQQRLEVEESRLVRRVALTEVRGHPSSARTILSYQGESAENGTK